MNEAKIIPIRIEDRELHSYFWRDKLTWIAGEVGRFLGYTKNGSKLNEAIRDNWRSELSEGVDYDILRGEDLADFKEFIGLTPSLGVSANTPGLLILYEPGLNKVCLLTTMPLGKQLRRFVAEEVMPRLARGEAILPPGGSALATVADAPPWVANILSTLAHASAQNAATLAQANATMAALGSSMGQVVVKVERLEGRMEHIDHEFKHIRRAIEGKRVEIGAHVKRMHRQTIVDHGGLCPCCGRVKILETVNGNALAQCEYDHFFARNRARIHETWLICKTCHDRISCNPRGHEEVELQFKTHQLRVSQTKGPQLDLLPGGQDGR